MTEPTDLEYCVRDHTGRIVVPWRPVGEVVAAGIGLSNAAILYGENLAGSALIEEQRSRLNALLGLEPAPDADR